MLCALSYNVGAPVGKGFGLCVAGVGAGSAAILGKVLVHHVRPVKVGQRGKRVDRDQDRARVSVDVVHHVAALQVPQHTGLMEVGESSCPVEG